MKKELLNFNSDPIARELIKAGKFEPEKYSLVNEKTWSEEIKTMNIKTIKEAMNTPAPSLASIRKYKGPEMCIKFVFKILNNFLQNFNVPNTMNSKQVEKAAQMIFQNYYYLTVADFNLCFNNAIMGKYGQIYNRIDIQVVCDWLNKYIEERLQAAQEAAQEKNRVEKMEKATEINPEGIRKISDMRQRLTKEGKIIDKERPMTEEQKKEGRKAAAFLMSNRPTALSEEMKKEMEEQAARLKKMLGL